MKVLVFGSGGQLGQCLLPKLEQFDVNSPGSRDLDLSNLAVIGDFILETKPDYIINLAAYTAVDKAESEAELADCINHLAVAEIAKASATLEIPLIHVSTDFVFSGEQSSPYTSDAHCQPIGAYGQSKYAGERAILEYKPQGSVILRTAWLYSDIGKNFLLSMLNLMRDRKSLGVVADQVGTPTSAYSLAGCITRFLNHSCEGIYHWTDAGVASWYDFAVAIYEEALQVGLVPEGVSIAPIPTAEYPTPAKRPSYSVLDKSKTYNDLSLEKIHWREELRYVINRLAATVD